MDHNERKFGEKVIDAEVKRADDDKRILLLEIADALSSIVGVVGAHLGQNYRSFCTLDILTLID